MKKQFLTFLSVLLPIIAFGQIIEKVYTRDGSIYEGYICEQIPSKKIIGVYSVRSKINFLTKNIENRRTDYRYLHQLGYAAKQDFTGNDDNELIEVISFKYLDGHYDDVKLLSEDLDTMQIISYTPKTYLLNLSDIIRTEKVYQEDDITDVITCKDGKVIKGKIKKQEIGKNYTIHTINEKTETYYNYQIEKIDSEFSEERKAINQIYLLDNIETRDGKQYKGFISSRVFGKSITFMHLNGSSKSFGLNEIVRYSKSINKEYIPKKKISKKEPVSKPNVNQSKVRTLNDIPAKKTSDFNVKVNNKEVSIISPILSSNSFFIKVPATTEIKCGQVALEINKRIDTQKIKLFKTKKKNYKGGDSALVYNQPYESFNIELNKDLNIIGCKHSENSSVINCVIDTPGCYFIMIDTNNNGILINVI